MSAMSIGFYGDSYTTGRGTSDQRMRWSTLLCERRGRHEINEGVSGLGFVRRRDDRDGHSRTVERLVAARPDVVLVSLGTNDTVVFADSAEAIRANITTGLDDLRSGLPASRIVVLEPFWAR